MAANFWLSTHCKNWMVHISPSKISKGNPKDQGALSPEEIDEIHQYCIDIIQSLGKRLSFRQQVIASAIVFYRRFYLSNSFVDFDPRLVAATVMYIAAKTEECQVRVDHIVYHLRHGTPDKNDRILKFKQQEILECEFYVVEALHFDLVIYHPYRPLMQYLADANLEDHCLQTAWNIVNDAYRTDAILLYPPYLLALAAIYMACIYIQRDPSEWFEKLNVNQDEVESIVKQMLHFYKRHVKSQPMEVEVVIGKLNDIVPPPSGT